MLPSADEADPSQVSQFCQWIYFDKTHRWKYARVRMVDKPNGKGNQQEYLNALEERATSVISIYTQSAVEFICENEWMSISVII